jgi:hypothetical protein
MTWKGRLLRPQVIPLFIYPHSSQIASPRLYCPCGSSTQLVMEKIMTVTPDSKGRSPTATQELTRSTTEPRVSIRTSRFNLPGKLESSHTGTM